jgi:hypothetical protein
VKKIGALLPAYSGDGAAIRSAIVREVRLSGKSRAQIADEMTRLVGREITERMLNAYTAESKEDHRWHAELTRAFCKVVGNNRLLFLLPGLDGFKVIDQRDQQLLLWAKKQQKILRLERSSAAVFAALEKPIRLQKEGPQGSDL